MKKNFSERIVSGAYKALARILLPFKWISDRRRLPLTPAHYDLYRIIHIRYMERLGRLPDLVNCPGFNDKIQWLKLFDQRPEVVSCSDKLLLRAFVESRLGPGYTPRLYQVGERFSDIDLSTLPRAFVIKTNHDSGSVILVRDKESLDVERARRRIDGSLKRRYGWKKGEWAYRWIVPRVFVEEFLSPDAATPPADFKFHCVDGRVKWLHYIYDRGMDTKEAIVDRDGVCLGISLFNKLKTVTEFERPEEWDRLVRIAESLATDFRYVRVDLYLVDGQIFVGEMTFHPKNGCYPGEGQLQLGKLMDFDRSYVKPLLCAPLEEQEREGDRSGKVPAVKA